VCKLKKNTTDEDVLEYDYSKGIGYYEEMRCHLTKCNRNNRAYRMGMEIILQHGLKSFFNKFKRKGIRLDHCDVPPAFAVHPYPGAETDGKDRELIYLLSEMIQAAGTHYGTEQKNYN